MNAECEGKKRGKDDPKPANTSNYKAELNTVWNEGCG